MQAQDTDRGSSTAAKRPGRKGFSYADGDDDEDWRKIIDTRDRRKIQNRLAQRKYRRRAQPHSDESSLTAQNQSVEKQGTATTRDHSALHTSDLDSPQTLSLDHNTSHLVTDLSADDLIFSDPVTDPSITTTDISVPLSPFHAYGNLDDFLEIPSTVCSTAGIASNSTGGRNNVESRDATQLTISVERTRTPHQDIDGSRNGRAGDEGRNAQPATYQVTVGHLREDALTCLLRALADLPREN